MKLPEPELNTAEAVAQALVGKKCYVNWPYLVEAIVVGTSDPDNKYYSPQHVYNPNAPSPNAYRNGLGAQRPLRTSANGDTNQQEGDTPSAAAETGVASGNKVPSDEPEEPINIMRKATTAESAGYFKKVLHSHLFRVLTLLKGR